MRSKVDKDLVGASTALLVLGSIAAEPTWGYEIVRRLNESAEGLFEWNEGTVYPILHKLEKQGLIRARWTESQPRRRRKLYTLTAKGRASLSTRAEQWSAFNELIARFSRPRTANG